MAIANRSLVLSRNQLIVSAICRKFDLDPKHFNGDVLQSDIKSLLENIDLAGESEVTEWVEFAENCNVDSETCLRALKELNGRLVSKSVLAGEGLTPTVADVVVFSALYITVKGLPDSERNSLPHALRWMDYIQNKEYFGESFEQISVEKDTFDPQEKVRGDSQAPAEKKKLRGKAVDEKDKNIGIDGTEKKKLAEKVAEEKDQDISVSLLKIQVGLIRKAWKHPSADSLLVEEIDIGDDKLRQVVSGLAKYCNPDDLTNRRVALITNVKHGKLRDVMSQGLVLCASNEDHTIVEPITPPEGAKVGECISFSGHEGKPEEVLNPKKKQLEKITPHLYTDDKGVATFKGIPFATSSGPCTSSIPNASIK